MAEVDPKTSEVITSANDSRPNVAFAAAGPTPAAPDMAQPASPAQAPMAVAQQPTPPVVATSKNPALHNLIGSVLGGLAGHPAPRYNYDENGRLVSSAAPESSSDKIRRIASNALTGLAAGNGPEKRSGLANVLSGVGEGAQAVKQQSQGQDVLKRAQAKEEYEQAQQAKLRQHEIARQNALTLSTYYGLKKTANEMDPHFAQNESLLNAVKASPELGAHATEMSDTQVEQEVAKDPQFATKHLIKPLGWAPESDPTTGQPVMVDGQPKFYMRMMVVDGTKDGKIAITPEMAQDFQKYGPMARVPNAGDLKAGDSYDLAQLLPAMNKIDEARKQVLDGWQKSELGWVADPKHPGKEIPVETNKMMPPDMEGRTRPLTVKPMALEAEEGKTALEKAQAGEAYGKMREALANAAAIANALPTGNQAMLPAYMDAISKLPQPAQAMLRNVSPQVQMSLLKLANGDEKLNEAFPTRVTKGSGQLDAEHASNLAALLNPQWTGGLYDTKKKSAASFADGEDGKGIASFNQFFVHAADLKAASERVQRINSPMLQKPINWLKTEGAGQPGVPALMTAIQTTRSEWQNFIKNGHAADLADSEQGRALMNDSSSPAQILDAAREMGLTGIGRLDQIDAKWRRTWGGHYPGLVSDSGRQGASELGLGDQLKQYPTESGAMFGVQNVNTPGAAQAPLTNIGVSADGKTKIGWDGKQYVDVDTRQPYVAPAPAGARP